MGKLRYVLHEGESEDSTPLFSVLCTLGDVYGVLNRVSPQDYLWHYEPEDRMVYDQEITDELLSTQVELVLDVCFPGFQTIENGVVCVAYIARDNDDLTLELTAEEYISIYGALRKEK